ncbi:MAG: DUF1588 domain-containing protein, partial [Planctomycetaceae bacterium]
VLSLTSDGTRHRPVHRGVWVSETVFGRTPPPPPPNVEPLQPTPAAESHTRGLPSAARLWDRVLPFISVYQRFGKSPRTDLGLESPSYMNAVDPQPQKVPSLAFISGSK